MKAIEGFSKLSKAAKLEWIAQQFSEDPEAFVDEFTSFWHDNAELQKRFDEFSENTVTNFYMPYGLAPNFLINDKLYAIPMVIEESSVVAAASKAAKFWKDKGGFKAEVVDIQKIGQVHFIWKGEFEKLKTFFQRIKPKMLRGVHAITRNMEKRGGGILEVDLVDMTGHEPNYYQIKATFDTCDAMGANFINSILEKFAAIMQEEALNYEGFSDDEKEIVVVLSILSNYTPDCLVRVWVECDIEELGTFEGGLEAKEFAEKFAIAVRIAQVAVHRATTHNKGIMNGIDAVILATGNDFRAIEAGAHTYAAKDGQYTSLTDVSLENGRFKYTLEVPLALGTVGGLTNLHPLVKRSLDILERPDAKELMMIAAAVGLANNFGAIKSMATVGIQQGHMKMHLLNILNSLDATDTEVEKAKEFFKTNVVSYTTARNFLISIRSNKPEFDNLH